MSLEIRELNIKVTVNQNAEPPSGVGGDTKTNNAPALSGDTSAIVAACVEQVLEILKEKTEA